MGKNDKRIRDERVANGLCSRCGKVPFVEGIRECSSCREKNLARQRKAYKENDSKRKRWHKRIANNLCGHCGKREPVFGKLSCDICLEKRKLEMQKLKDVCFEAYGGYVCACCGENIKQFLVLDHVNNDGAEHRRTFSSKRDKKGNSTRDIYYWAIKNNFPPSLQVLCSNCNQGKKMNNGVCPHLTN